MSKKPQHKLAALLLAAGASERLGKPKQLVELNGESLVLRAARLLLTQTPNVTVVTGAHATDVGKQLAGLRVGIRRNEDWSSGMGGSIAFGMKNIGETFDGVLITLCDQWRINQQDLASLSAAWKNFPSHAVVAHWSETFGAPAIFPRSLFPELRNLKGDRGAKALITKQLEVEFREIPNAAYEMDTEADLQAMLSSATQTESR